VSNARGRKETITNLQKVCTEARYVDVSVPSALTVTSLRSMVLFAIEMENLELSIFLYTKFSVMEAEKFWPVT
jgi:hypothetical protein